MSGEGFLSRWSRRKRAAEAGAPEPEAPAPAPAPSALPAPASEVAPKTSPDEPGPAASLPAEPEFDLASLPPIETLTAESDFSAFLRKGVPDGLRRAALRKAWSLDPVISTYIGPADYAWDFNAPDGVPGFALELGTDVRRLLAQAVGLDPEEEREGEPGREEDGMPEVAAAEPLAAPDGSAEALEPGATAPALAAVAADGTPAPEAATVAAAAEAPDPVPRPRKHGSALPS